MYNLLYNGYVGRVQCMKISKKRFRIIGRLIGIYREEQKRSSQNVWTQKKFCEDVCSPNTLKNIEAGKISRSLEVYIDLLAKLNLKVGEFPEIDEAIHVLIKELYVAIEYFDRTSIERITNKANRLLSKVGNYVYYSEVKCIFQDIKDYYILDIHLSDKNKKRYLEELDIFDLRFTNILKVIILAKAKVDCMGDETSYFNVVDRLDIEKSDYPCIQMNLLHYFYMTNRNFKMNALLKELEVKFRKEGNIVRLLDIYNYSIILLSEFDKEECLFYIKEVEKMLETMKLPRIKVAEVYGNIATSYYVNSEYAIAKEYFEKAARVHLKEQLPRLFLLADCQRHLGETIAIDYIAEADLKHYSIELQMMYRYFVLKDVPVFIRQNFIMKQILPILDDALLINVFRHELTKLVEQSNQYKNLYIFDKIVAEKR